MRHPLVSSSLSKLARAASLALVVGAGCTEENPGGGGDGGDAPDGAASAKLPVGSQCSAASECAGPGTPLCITEVRPLEGMLGDASVPENIRGVGVDFPGGYCSTRPNCKTDADCGAGGTCFWPFKNVTQQTVDELQMAVGADLSAFKEYAVCLKACTDDSECRPGYRCQVPIGSLLALVAGADTDHNFCIGDPTCAQCDENADCTMDTGRSECVCRAGYEGDGKTCTAVCSPACGANATCDDKGACQCDEGFHGDPVAGCEITNPCVQANPCKNGGTCNMSGPGAYACCRPAALG